MVYGSEEVVGSGEIAREWLLWRQLHLFAVACERLETMF